MSQIIQLLHFTLWHYLLHYTLYTTLNKNIYKIRVWFKPRFSCLLSVIVCFFLIANNTITLSKPSNPFKKIHILYMQRIFLIYSQEGIFNMWAYLSAGWVNDHMVVLKSYEIKSKQINFGAHFDPNNNEDIAVIIYFVMLQFNISFTLIFNNSFFIEI